MSYSGYFLVRDMNGNPKFDSWNNIHEAYWELLTEDEQASIINYRKSGVLSWQ